jgi:uncharacterized repeat protein (TIGR03803 family)
MKTQFATIQNGRGTSAITKPGRERRPGLALRLWLLWAAALLLPTFCAEARAVFTSLHSFQVSTNGVSPLAPLVQGGDGNLYGTTESGGTNGGYGTVFKISTNGALTSLYSFTGGNDGANPEAGLVQGSDGSFYGTTIAGGTNYYGTVFKISTDGALTSLYSFSGGNDGAEPAAGLVQGSDGFFYGTTEGGGTNDAGTIFQISTGGVLTSWYSFSGGNDGANPEAGLVQGSDGFFYGTTESGGSTNLGGGSGLGTVFQIRAIGALTTLYTFGMITNMSGEAVDGAYPDAGLVQGSGGFFYGTTEFGGTNDSGTVFKINSASELTSLYSFSGGDDGSNPDAGLVQDSEGNFYGTTENGGTNYAGTVFKIGAGGALASLYSFSGGNDGASPEAGLVQGSDGYLYGTTFEGGAQSQGTVFQISTSGNLTSLYSFTSVSDGANPVAGLVQGSDGNFYGTTENGGTNDSGTVFQMRSNGALASLYSFSGGDDGAGPLAGLVQGNDGFFYGTTYNGGTNSSGNIFQISSNGALRSLFSFIGGTNGAYPAAGLVQVSAGNFFGTTSEGGTTVALSSGYGTVFQFSTDGALSNLYSFALGNEGAYPDAGLMRGSDGNYYGTTYAGGAYDFNSEGFGTVFKISTSGGFNSLYSFTGGNDGSNPDAGLVQASDGFFYGTTEFGGTNDSGTVFKISSGGGFSSLYSFTGTNDGAFPEAGLVQGSDGFLYGTTESGGSYTNQDGQSFGTVFKISTSGTLTSLYSFTGGNDGAYPEAGLVQGSDGSFYGTTESGGEGAAGTVFRLTVAATAAAPVFQSATLTHGTLSLTWTTEPGGMYQLQYNSDLNSSIWNNLGSALTATGATLSTNETVTNGPPRFYRVEVLP